MSGHRQDFVLRPLHEDDVDAVIRVWHESKRVAYPYIAQEQGLTLADNQRLFRLIILPRNTIWVACAGDEIAGFLAIQGSYVDRLYVLPERQRQGTGSALMAKAKELSPAGVQLHTHQKNTLARAFYEQHGFQAVKFGISPPPESEPDVEYHWAPVDDQALTRSRRRPHP